MLKTIAEREHNSACNLQFAERARCSKRLETRDSRAGLLPVQEDFYHMQETMRDQLSSALACISQSKDADEADHSNPLL
jgi:hypothetical protein